ncbi:L-threonylcarbamoyladenylate synthase [Geitlerinema sp. PCC 9228]|jgi:tRNA threonylcarbamoyl adenosine modification protein (Sua5/YciO/YrdC/YwlC family)|uniref:L-threonylcarbamoyladenylate synthase n=1 Tax=Geitlerinema sp. PCC 9228 TaxID=111611 RepID=UPI0008F9CDE4|nr:L-threonylcarbamoyladenylate synthase [Geitlerinema sp. PCC 9228]
MATKYTIHPETPQIYTIDRIVSELRNGAIVLYPTDTVYAIGCDINVKSAVERVRRIKRLSNDKPLTFLCSSISNTAAYAQVSDISYRIMRNLVPGPYTFLLPATKQVPKIVMDPKRKTTGIRIPDSHVCQALLKALGSPMISTSAHPLPPELTKYHDIPFLQRMDLFDELEKLVDVIVDNEQEQGTQVSTIIDLTGDEVEIVRKGLGWEDAADLVAQIG